jgi:hypothetical protein
MMKSAAELIATVLSRDLHEVKTSRHKPEIYSQVALYSIEGNLYCAPRQGHRPPRGFSWSQWKVVEGRQLFMAPYSEQKVA